MQEHSPSTRQETPSSELLEELEILRGRNPALNRLLLNGGQLTAKRYIDFNWCGDPPDEFSEDEQQLIDLLLEYEAQHQP